jgi:hypothetical protein
MPGQRLSRLWDNNRGQFAAFQLALAKLSNAYDNRLGDRTEHGRRIRISIDDIDGLPITATFPLPIAALDDLLLLVQGLTRRRREENREQGYTQEHEADHVINYFDRHLERGHDADELRALARDHYAEAAERTEQPEDLDTLQEPPCL